MDDLEEKIKQAQEAEARSEFLGASIYYKEALEIAKKLGISDKIKELKSKVTTLSQNIDWVSLEAQQRVPQEEIDKFVATVITNDDLNTILKNIGVHPYLRPRIEDIKRQAKETMPVTYNIVSLVTFSSEGHVVDEGDNPLSSWTAKIYEISQGMISNLYLKRIFSDLREQKGLNAESLYNYIEQKRTFPPDSLPIIKRGIERYFDGDYISSIHILILQFENVLLKISEKFGIDIIALNRGIGVATSTKVMSENLLDDQKFREVWGEDFCEQIKYVLLKPLGYRLRHKVAHGEITVEECNQQNADLILHLILILAGRVEMQKK